MAGMLWLPQLILVGDEMFKSETPRLEASIPLAALTLVVTGLIQVAASVWSFFTVLKCIGEAHRFSAWRALGSLLLAGFIVVLIIVIPILIFVGIAFAIMR